MQKLKAVDLFAGAGGATQGLLDAGFEVVGAVEIDQDASDTYHANHQNVMLKRCDVRAVSASGWRKELNLDLGELDLLKACPPCQGFSSLAEGRVLEDVQRNDLVLSVMRFVRAFRPRAVLLENVPGLQRDRRFDELLQQMHVAGYATQQFIVKADDFGVPQQRRRLIVIALRGLRRKADLPTQLALAEPSARRTVGDVLAELKKADLSADSLNVSRQLRQSTVARIKAVPVGGGRQDLPAELQLECHRRLDGNRSGAASSYGRLRVDQPAPTMTTRCTTPACGRFTHPFEHRGITLREAATIQTFPISYRFMGGYGSIERQIGNAVPVHLAAHIGRQVLALLTPARAG